MSKFLRLSSINQDIQLLEQAGDYKSASILHKKFLREAQAAVPYTDPAAAVTNFQVGFQNLGNAMAQPQPTTGDVANQMQAMNTMPAESPIYQQAINQIAGLLNTKNPVNRTMAQQIYENTIVQFKDPKRKQAFANQYQRLVSKNFPAQSLKPGSY